MRYHAVIPAAGRGTRFGGDVPKQYAALAGRSVIEWSLEPFLADERCRSVVVALAPDDAHWPAIEARLGAAASKLRRAAGGAERVNSVANALAALSDDAGADDWVLVHDAARPCLTRADLDRLLAAAQQPAASGALLAQPIADTVKRSRAGTVETLPRHELWRAQTPQMFRRGALAQALSAAIAAQRVPTDEAQAMEWQGVAAALVAGAPGNIKITSAGDLALAEAFLASDPAIAAASGAVETRVGSGFDVHAFGPGDHVMLAGVKLPHDRGIVAHSDGDVLLHALCDALLGAAGLGDIGQHFPDSDPRWRGADSGRFVTHVVGLLARDGWTVGNADLTLIAEAPRLGAHRETMRERVAALLGVAANAVNLKATTTEKLGFIGRREGLAAQAQVQIRRGTTTAAR